MTLSHRLSTIVRMMDPRPRYAVSWMRGDRARYVRGTFRQCNTVMLALLADSGVHAIAGYGPGDVEDTFLFPATGLDFPSDDSDGRDGHPAGDYGLAWDTRRRAAPCPGGC